MEEQSHKNAMRAAVEGEFARLRARREGAGEPVAAASEPVPAPVATPVSQPTVPPVSQPTVPPVSQPTVVAPEPERTSWLDRLRDRR